MLDKKPVYGRRLVPYEGRAADLAARFEPVLEAQGYRLVRVVVNEQTQLQIQVMLDRQEKGVTITDCGRVTHLLNRLLEADGLDVQAYQLEVSSTGMDRPLVTWDDLIAWKGSCVRVKLRNATELGMKRVQGLLEGVNEDTQEIQIRPIVKPQDGLTRPLPKKHQPVKESYGDTLTVAISAVASIRLVITDALIREALREGKTSSL